MKTYLHYLSFIFCGFISQNIYAQNNTSLTPDQLTFNESSTRKAFIDWTGSDLILENDETGSDRDIRLDADNGDVELAAGDDVFIVTAGNTRLFVNEQGNIGLGTLSPSKRLDVRGFQKLDFSRSDISASGLNVGINMNISGTGTAFGGLAVRYNSATSAGVGIFALPSGTGGINVGGSTGGAFRPVNASAFNVRSDKRVKKSIRIITEGKASTFMKQIRRIESATFWYNTENKRNRPVPHIGVIAQSLPKELQVEIDETSNGATGVKCLGVSLSDWLGLVTIGVKENDINVQQLKKEVRKFQSENEALAERIVQLENQLKALLANKKEEAGQKTTIHQRAYIQQNQPNPFNGNTEIPYFLPKNTQNAHLRIVTLDGKIIKDFPLATDKNSVTLNATELVDGNYFYSLVVDGKIVDTKQMVLIK